MRLTQRQKEIVILRKIRNWSKKERQKERSRKCCYDTVYDTIPELFQSLESTQTVLADEDLKENRQPSCRDFESALLVGAVYQPPLKTFPAPADGEIRY